MQQNPGAGGQKGKGLAGGGPRPDLWRDGASQPPHLSQNKTKRKKKKTAAPPKNIVGGMNFPGYSNKKDWGTQTKGTNGENHPSAEKRKKYDAKGKELRRSVKKDWRLRTTLNRQGRKAKTNQGVVRVYYPWEGGASVSADKRNRPRVSRNCAGQEAEEIKNEKGTRAEWGGLGMGTSKPLEKVGKKKTNKKATERWPVFGRGVKQPHMSSNKGSAKVQ